MTSARLEKQVRVSILSWGVVFNHSKRVFSYAVYSGPSTSFNYVKFRGFGAAQFILGCVLSLLGLIQIAIDDTDRAIALLSGLVVVWMPMFVSAASHQS